MLRRRVFPAHEFGGMMRKYVQLLAVVLVASISTAEAASTKRKPAEPEDLNANGKKLVMDGLPLVMPSAVMLYMLHNKEVEAKKAEQQKKKI
jgi:hypothetical protein